MLRISSMDSSEIQHDSTSSRFACASHLVLCRSTATLTQTHRIEHCHDSSAAAPASGRGPRPLSPHAGPAGRTPAACRPAKWVYITSFSRVEYWRRILHELAPLQLVSACDQRFDLASELP